MGDIEIDKFCPPIETEGSVGSLGELGSEDMYPSDPFLSSR